MHPTSAPARITTVVAQSEQHFRWSWELAAPPDALWPLVSNTDRFNRDCGYPTVTVVSPPAVGTARVTNTRRLRARKLGLTLEWEEQAFEWVAPKRFAVDRRFLRGPFARMRVSCELVPAQDGGTTLHYAICVTADNPIGRAVAAFSIGKHARAATERVFRRYDEFALRGLRSSQLARPPALADGGAARLERIGRTLVDQARQPARLVEQLQIFLTSADDLAAARIRPYALADEWHGDRAETLALFLHATRAGVLDFSWDLVCPHCRGAKSSQASLRTLPAEAHCDSCQIDFTANFDRSVELTFTPNAAIRPVVRADYCVGGPQVTPHIVAQLQLAGGEQRTLQLELARGRYRVRTPTLPGQHVFRIDRAGAAVGRIDLGSTTLGEPGLAMGSALTLANPTDTPHLAIVEHLAWSDQATTAAEVTSLQLFRDLFSREVLRRGEQIRVGALTVVFTDLKNSTQLYQAIGDAPAFGRVLTHFEILKACVAAEHGAIVKTMGDAIMAVFPRPIAAVRAMLHAQDWLAHPQKFSLPDGVTVPPSSLKPLALKAGIHSGPCLAINQNDRLDYFGTTVNTTARLCALSCGTDVILSAPCRADAEVAAYLGGDAAFQLARENTRLKGFDDAAFEVWRIMRPDVAVEVTRRTSGIAK